MITRREVFSMIAAMAVKSTPPLFTQKTGLKLIAHRGGVVDDGHVENSPASLEAAIGREYWMAEVDVRRTRDGQAVLQYDSDFNRYYADPRRVSEMDWADIKKLRATSGGSRPMAFDELAALCKGKIRLMLDVKEEPHPPEFYALLKASLVQNGLLASTYILSGEDAEKAFRGLGPTAATDGAALRAADARGENLASLYYLFEGADKIQVESIELARKHGVDVVAAVNTFHYQGADGLGRAQADLRRALQLGVTTFQIDSAYESYLKAL